MFSFALSLGANFSAGISLSLYIFAYNPFGLRKELRRLA
jgi:hypothetical protein